MKFDLSNDFDLKKFESRIKNLVKNKKKVELKEIRQSRSLSQNAYLHVCLSMFGIEFGLSIDEVKQMLKTECQFMSYEKNGTIFLKSTSMLNTKELTAFIEWIRTFASQHGLYIPTSEEYIMNRFEIDKSIDQHSSFL
jgi:hypothetical protein